MSLRAVRRCRSGDRVAGVADRRLAVAARLAPSRVGRVQPVHEIASPLQDVPPPEDEPAREVRRAHRRDVLLERDALDGCQCIAVGIGVGDDRRGLALGEVGGGEPQQCLTSEGGAVEVDPPALEAVCRRGGVHAQPPRPGEAVARELDD